MSTPNQKQFSLPPSVRETAARLKAQGHQVYVVGGALRDSLLGRPVLDWDLATSARPEEVSGIFKKVIPTGLKHGTVTVLAESSGNAEQKLPIEVTTLRLEGPYKDGRHPESVTFTANLSEDLARRDFTINAMAWDPLSENFYDPFSGLQDLQAKLIRTVGKAVDRFQEDGLRPIRAIRFAAQLEFELHLETLAAISETLEVTRLVAMERVRDELLKILKAPVPSIAFKLFKKTGLLAWIMPELMEGVDVTQNEFHAYDVFEHSLRACDAGDPNSPLLRLALLLHDVAKPRTRQFLKGTHHFYGHDRIGANMTDDILTRLRFSNAERAHIVNLVSHHMFYYQEQWTDAAVRRLMRKVGEENMEDLLALRIADEKASGVNAPDYERLQAFRKRIEKIKSEEVAFNVRQLAINGNEVMQTLGLPPGEQVGAILTELLEKVLDDPSLNEREKLIEIVKTLRPRD